MSARRTNIAIFNPIFAHYREALLRELETRGAHEYHFYADSRDRIWGIPALDLTGNPRFTCTPCTRVLRGMTWQAGALRAALTGRHDTFIFLGNPTWISTWLAAIAARLRGRRVLFWTHGWTRIDRGPKRFVRLAFYRLAHGLLLYGERAKRIALEFGFHVSRLHVIYNSLDHDRQRALLDRLDGRCRSATRAELFGDGSIPVVIATARLTSRKRFDLLIAAASILAKRGVALHLLIVGDGPERTRLEWQARELGIGAVFAGACYEEAALARWFSIAAVCVSPGNVGLTCMHSLGYGVPVITHDDPADQMPEYEAITPGATGDFFRKGSAQDLANVMQRWVVRADVEDAVRQRCMNIIRERYHPAVQRALIESAARAETVD